MNHDCSYLRTEYARNKEIECYDIEWKEREKAEQLRGEIDARQAEKPVETAADSQKPS